MCIGPRETKAQQILEIFASCSDKVAAIFQWDKKTILELRCVYSPCAATTNTKAGLFFLKIYSTYHAVYDLADPDLYLFINKISRITKW